MNSAEEPRAGGTSRRALLSLATMAGVSFAASKLFAGASALGAPTPSGRASAPLATSTDPFPGIPGATNDLKALNFALTLEILESDLYRQALNKASGRPLTADLDPAGPSAYHQTIASGGLSTAKAQHGFAYLKHFAYVEAAHRKLLKGVIPTLGGTPVQRNPNGYAFPGGVGSDLKAILTQILPLEETGVRAYLGALGHVDTLAIAQAAGEIYSTEARHSAVIAYTLGIDPGPRKETGDLQVVQNQPAQNTFEYFLEPSTVLTAARAYFL